MGDTMGPSASDEVKEMAILADTAGEAECLGKSYVGMTEPAN